MEMEPMPTSSKHSTGHASNVQTKQNENYLTDPNERHVEKDKGSSKIIPMNPTTTLDPSSTVVIFLYLFTLPCSRSPLHDVTVHDHILHHVAVHLHHLHVHST